jgi:hypothetical protein
VVSRLFHFDFFSIFFKISKSKKSVVSLDITLKKRKRRFFKKLVIFELLQLFNFSDNFQNPFCISYSSEFSVHDFIIVWSFIQYLSLVIVFLPRHDFARILLAERRLSSRSILHIYLEREKRVRERERKEAVFCDAVPPAQIVSILFSSIVILCVCTWLYYTTICTYHTNSSTINSSSIIIIIIITITNTSNIIILPIIYLLFS